MFKKILTLLPVFALSFNLLAAPMAGAAVCSDPKDCINQGVSATDTGSNASDVKTIINTITTVLLFIVGAVGVIMIVISGFKYVVSNGDSNQVKSAKDTLFYAIVGIIVAIAAYALVNFVINELLR